MLRFNDPITIAVSLLAVSAGLSFLGSVQEGKAAKEDAQAEASFLEAEAGQEQKQAGREIRDAEKERARTLARTRAVLAARGVDLADATAVGLLAAQNAEIDIRGRRTVQDSEARQTSLLVRAGNVRRTGRIQQQQSIIGGAARAASAGASVFKGVG